MKCCVRLYVNSVFDIKEDLLHYGISYSFTQAFVRIFRDGSLKIFMSAFDVCCNKHFCLTKSNFWKISVLISCPLVSVNGRI